MDKMNDDIRNNNYEDFIDNRNCGTCGLQKFQVDKEDTVDTQIEIKIKNTICLIKSKITHLHEQILGCTEYDENTKPKVALSVDEFLATKAFKELQKQHRNVLKDFFDPQTYQIQSLPTLIPVDNVNFVYIETTEECNIMIDKLVKYKDIAVNLEFYTRRSYSGFTWLLQISTEDTYYMINCPKLQKQLHILNTIFMDINILKIFHDGENMVLRLYKDFGILVINMFDTAILHKVMSESKKKDLLQKYTNFETSKIHTHFLIFLKTYLINLAIKLHKKKYLKIMHQSCKRICKEVYNNIDWNKFSVKNVLPNTATNKQRYVATELLKWRDEIAKKEDESPNFILPDNNIFEIVQELLDNRKITTLSKCYGIKFWYDEETYFNMNRVLFKAQKVSNKRKHYQRFLDVQNKNYIKLQSNAKNTKDQKKILEKQKLIKIKSNKPVKKTIKKLQVSGMRRILEVRNLIEQSLLKILKPQTSFADTADNDSLIWKPNITKKPNALKPLDLHLEHQGLKLRYCHPYKTELQNFIVPCNQLVKQTPTEFKKLETTPLHIIKTEEQLQSMLNDLKKYCKLAVDLKFNEKRSYLGYTCFLVISTRDSDYIVDALLLRSELHILNEIFTDSTILKVFHGSVRQMMWLQKDFSVYVINMFDTARTINIANEKKRLNLINLKNMICKIPLKKINEAELSAVEKDWRVRPISIRVKNYLRTSSHHLLYIKDILSNELFMCSNLLIRFYKYCTDLCKNIYCKPFYPRKSYKNILEKKLVKNKYAGHAVRIRVLKELHKLRYNIAQKDDEDPEFVMSNYILLKLVDILPKDIQKIADLWKYDKERIYTSQVQKIICSASNVKVSLKNDNDIYEWKISNEDKYENERLSAKHENDENYGKKDYHATLADFLCNNEAIKNGTLHLERNDYQPQARPQARPQMKKKKSHGKKKELEDRSFIVVKGKYWHSHQTIKDWLKNWINVEWSEEFEVKEIQERKMKITLKSKKFKDIMWSKRYLIHNQEGTLISKDLTANEQKIQKILLNISKDLRASGLQVKIRDTGIKIETKWYEWKFEGGLHEISEEEARKKV